MPTFSPSSARGIWAAERLRDAAEDSAAAAESARI